MGIEKIRSKFKRPVLLPDGTVHNLTDGTASVVTRTGGVQKIKKFFRRPVVVASLIGGTSATVIMGGTGAATTLTSSIGPVTATTDSTMLLFGDSIERHDYKPDSYTAPKALLYNNVGEYRIALSRLGYPLAFDNYIDTVNVRPADSESSSSTIPVNGYNYGQSGGTIANIELEVETARARGVNPKIIFYEGGINNYNTANDGTFANQSARYTYAALMDRIADYWPNAILVRANVRPTSARGITPTSTMVTQINADVAARPNWTLLDVANAYGTFDATDFQNDNVHPNALGASRKGAPVVQAMLTNKLGSANTITTGREVTQLGNALAGAATAFNLSPGTGSASGSLPAGVAMSALSGGTLGAGVTITASVITSANTNKPAIRLSIASTGAGSATSSGLTLTFGYTGSQAGNYVEAKTFFRDNLLGMVNFRNALIEASDATQYGDAQVPAYPANRTSNATMITSAPRKAIAGSTGLTMQIDMTYDASVANTYTVDIEDWHSYTRTSPEVSYADPDATVYDTDAQAYITATKLRDVPTKTAINALVVGLKADGLWAKLDNLYILANWSRTTGYINLRAPTTGMAWVSGDWRPKGFKGFGISEYAAYPAAYYTAGSTQFQQDSASIFAYATEQDTSVSEGIQLGTNNNTVIAMIRPVSGGTDKYRLNTTTEIAVTNPGTRAGFRLASRTASNLVTAYYGSGGSVSAVGTTTAASVAPDTAIPRLLATSLGGPVYYGGDRLGATGSGSGMTAADAANLYARLRTYLTAINVVAP